MTVLTFFVIMLEKINTNEKLKIVIVKEYQHKSTVKGFHVYKEIWNPVEGEVLDTRMELENPADKYAVWIEKNGNDVGQMPRRKYSCFSKTIFFFLRADEYGSCKVRINKSKAINRGDGIEIECALEFIGQRRFINISKGNLKD